MKNSSILLFLLILVSPFIQNANGDLFNFSSSTEIPADSTVNHIRLKDANLYIDKNTNQASWQTAPLWMQDYTDYQGQPVYIPYKFYSGDGYYNIESAQGSLSAYTDTCSIKLYDAGHINETSIPIINDISFSLQTAQNGTDNWQQSQINSENCITSYSEQSNGMTLNMTQGSTSDILKTVQIKIQDGKIPEIIPQVTNYNQTNNNTKFGFSLSMTGTPLVTFDNETLTFWENGKRVLSFDTQNSVNHYLWTAKIISNNVILDYKNSKGPLEYGQTLEIDPTFTSTDTNNAYTITYTGASSCPVSNPSPSSKTATNQAQSYDASGAGNGCARAAIRFTISSFPTAVQSIRTVQISGTFTTSTNVAFSKETSDDPSTASINTLWADIVSTNSYATVSSNGAQKILLVNNVVADFVSQEPKGWFAVNWVILNTALIANTVNNPVLIVNYTMPVPNQVTGLSCSSNSPMTNTCTWNTPTIPTNGSDTLGYYVNKGTLNPPLYSSNLVGYWKFDGVNSKNQVPDYSSSGNNATLQAGSYTFLRGIIGGSENFTGTQYLSASGSSLPVGTSDRSVSFWIKTPSTFRIFDMIFSYGAGTSNNMFGAFWASSGSTSALIMWGDNNDVSSNTIFQPNTWYNIVITLHSNGTIRNLYVNGILDISSTTTALNTSSSSLYFGTREDNIGTDLLESSLDDFRVYNRVLTQPEITNLENYRLVNNPIMSQYSFDNSLRDSIGGDNGTAVGGVSYTTGKFGQALVLQGSSYITLANKNDFQFDRQDKFSFDFWIKTTSNTQSLFSNQPNSGLFNGYIIYLNGNGKVEIFFTSSGPGIDVIEPIIINDNNWHNVAITYNGNGLASGINVYIDNILQSLTINSNTLNGSMLSNLPLLIGSRQGSLQFNGEFDEVRIFQNYVLTQQNITNLYNSNVYSFTPTYIDNYLLSDGNTYSYQVYPVNLFGQNNTSTTVNTITTNYAPPPSVSGKFYKDASNLYHVQFNWSQPPQANSDPYRATGYQILNCNSGCTVLANNQTSPFFYTFSNLAQQTFQKLQVKSWSHFGLSPGYSFVKSNATSLVSHWPMDNSTIDVGPQATPLTVSGNENYTVGHNGYALNLDGISWATPTSQITSLYSYEITNPFTLSTWVKTTQSGHFNGILTKDNNGTDNGWYTMQNGTKTSFVIRSGGTSYSITGSKTINNGDWQYLTFVYSGNSNKNGMQIYTNGTLDVTGVNTSISGSALNSDLFTIGSYSNGLSGGQGTSWNGFIDDPRIYSSALNSTQVSELWNEQITTRTNNNINQITGTHILSHNTVGNMDRESSLLTITGGFPSPTITNFHLYNNTTVKNNTNVNIAANSGATTTFLYSNWFNVTHGTNFKGVAVISNGTATELINSSSYPVGPSYNPSYKPASNGDRYNYTLLRTNSGTNVTLRSNVTPVLFNMSCQYQTSGSPVGGGNGWFNQSKVGFYQQSVTVHSYDNVYGTCYDPDPTLLLFSFVSYGNSSIFPAINLMNTSYQGYIGVPVGVLFLVIMGALANKRTAPTWGIILIVVAGILATVGFFTLSTGYWALIIIAGLLISFVGRKVL